MNDVKNITSFGHYLYSFGMACLVKKEKKDLAS